LSYYPKTAILPLCSIYRHGGHDGWSAGSSDITFKGNLLRTIQAKFGLNWPSGFRGEYVLKSLQTDDGRQVMAITHTAELKMRFLSRYLYVIVTGITSIIYVVTESYLWWWSYRKWSRAHEQPEITGSDVTRSHRKWSRAHA
jgi:hypothetical protein